MTAPLAPPPSRRSARAVTLIVAGALFMEMLDGTVIATALPNMARSFHVSAVALNIGITAYLLALAVFIPISGWIADRFGSRTVFGGALLLFTLASLLCALSPNLAAFTAARVLQGMGGAAMVPVGRLIVLRMTEKSQLMNAIGTIVWPGLVAPVLGPPLGGFLVTHYSWPWIFLLNLPLGLAALLFTVLLVPNQRPAERRALDLVGFALSGAALALTVYGIDAFGNRQGRPEVALGLVAAGLVLGWFAVRHFRRHPTPLLDLAPLAIPTYAVGVWGGSLVRIALGSAPFLLPLLFQLAFGLDAFTSGMLVLWVFAGNLGMKLVTTQILRRFGFRTVMLVNGLLTAASLAACALLTAATPVPAIAALLFAGGAFRSMQFTALTTIQFADVPPAQINGANTLSSMLSQLTIGVGVVIGAAALNLSAAARGRPAGVPDLTDFRFAFLLAGLLALVGLWDSLRLSGDAGQAVSGHVRRQSRT